MLHVAENNKLFTAAIEVRSSSFERQVLQQDAKVVVGLEALTIVFVGPNRINEYSLSVYRA